MNEVKPGRYGVPKPFYFPFLLSYWCNTQQVLSKSKKLKIMQSVTQDDTSAHEKVRGNPAVGIRIRHLTKVYSSWFGNRGVRENAVDNLNLDIYKGQITVLLGHNGAGKTTIMSILTGLFPPTEGTAIINGYNILTDMDLIRECIGICPQHNVLFGRLTVKEHLNFFMRLKGIHDRKIIKAEVDQMLSDMFLSDKRDTQASHLSGGMKRKLSVGIALIGSSEVVILDEPTAGMDPYARRATWDLLAKYKKNHCILLSTHFMDEADLLGDRIAIMAEGKLRCSGSPLFLKNLYGVGYHMTLLKEKKLVTSEIEHIVKSFVPSAERLTDVGMELSFILPSTAASSFPDLFENLEKMKATLGIASFGISITTMEEVFLKVTEYEDKPFDDSVKNKWWINIARKFQSKRQLQSSVDTESGNQSIPTNHADSLNSKIFPSTTIKSRSFINKQINGDNNKTCSVIESDLCSISNDQIQPASADEGKNKETNKKVHSSSNHALWNSDNKGDRTLEENMSSVKEEELCQKGHLLKRDKVPPIALNKKDQSSEKKKEAEITPAPAVIDDYGRYTPPCGFGENKSELFNKRRNILILPPLETNVDDSKSGHSEVVLKSSQARTTQISSLYKQNNKPLPPIQGDSSCMVHESDLLQDDLACQYTPNRGIILWLQQFRAMFIKRLCYSIRYYRSLITQLILPTLFTAMGLLVIIYSSEEDDTEDAFHIGNTIFDQRNTMLFYAELDGNSMNFSEFSAKDISVTNFFDITSGVKELRNSIMKINNTDDCCKYKYQILDKFCASHNAFELYYCKERNPLFGYSSCIHCLTCCLAVNEMDSCSVISFFLPHQRTNRFCPSPPSLSLYSSTTGPLDTTNTFVAEYILRLTEAVGTIHFFQAYQAGFTIAAQDPIFSGCDCGKVQGKSSHGCTLLKELGTNPCHNNDPCPIYRYIHPKECPSKQLNETLCRQKPTCYDVEQLTAVVFPQMLCRTHRCDRYNPKVMLDITSSDNTRSLSKVHPENLPTPAVTVWYNNAEKYIVPAALNAYQNMRLKQIMRNKKFTITVIDHPLPREVVKTLNIMDDFLGYLLSILVVFGYSFCLANFVIFFIREKQSKAKHLQFVSGVTVTNYWFSALVYDLMSAFVPIILTVVVFRSFSVEAYHGSALTAVFLVLVLTCWVGIPLTYIFSFIFTNALVAFSILVIVFFIITVLELVAIFLVSVSDVKNKDKLMDMLHHIFLWTPTYGLASILNDIYINHQTMEYCLQLNYTCTRLNIKYVESSLILQELGVKDTCIYLTIQGVAFMAITFLLELKCFVPHIMVFFSKLKIEQNMKLPEVLPQDEDVCDERNRVLSGNTGNDMVVLKNLVKIYNHYLTGCHRPKIALAGISLGIPCGECFGLLGLNGAGKTTTFSILTGDISMTYGTATIYGNNIQTSLKTVQQSIGYCPQFDALIECMTACEHLWMYARLRGVLEDKIHETVQTELQRLDLVKYANTRCETYSGGVRRKLSTAIAMVGNPPILLLDEPTTGVDPKTRHYLWDVLTKVTSEGRSVILTTHSMEECEALCTRLAIMVNGQFRCLGSTQHLKSKYGSGITVQVKVECSTLDDVCAQLDMRSRLYSLQPVNQQQPRSHKNHLFSRQYQRSRASSYDIGIHPSSRRISRTSTNTSNWYNTTGIHFFIKENFDNAVLVEELLGVVTYWLPSDEISWSKVFRLLEENKEDLGIIDYSVSQTTLEQVFIRFAKEQEETVVN